MASESIELEKQEQAVLAIDAALAKITVRDLDFYYGDAQALHRIGVDFAERKVTALIGPSGCGKSTLLRTLNRIFTLYPGQRASGTVRLDDIDVLSPKTNLGELRARIGMVFQKPTPFPMSIYENVAYGIRLYRKMSRADLDTKVEEALRRAVLWDEVKDRLRKPGTGLSGGQQQRLCLARSIALEPEVLLLDEPTSALDPISTAKLEESIYELKRDCTVIIVTHNLGQAARISDYTGFMYEGRMIEFQTTETIFAMPKTKQALDYIIGRYA